MPPRKFHATDDLRRQVKALAGFGVTARQICSLIGLRSTKTLRKHFRTELDLGPIEALASVKRTRFRLAASGRNPRMTKRWLEQRARWSSNMKSRIRADSPTRIKWIIELDQPPAPALDAEGLAALLEGSTIAREWDGDRPDHTEVDG
jgi:hypothetical protein